MLLVLTDDELKDNATIIELNSGKVVWKKVYNDSSSSNSEMLFWNAILIDNKDAVWIENAKSWKSGFLEIEKYIEDGQLDCKYSLQINESSVNRYLSTELLKLYPNIIYQVNTTKTVNGGENTSQYYIINDECKSDNIVFYNVTNDLTKELFYSEEEGIIVVFSANNRIYLGKKRTETEEPEVIYLADEINNYDAKYLRETGNFILITDSYGTNTCQITWYNLMGDELWSKEVENCVNPNIIYSDPDRMEIIFSADSSIDEFHDWLLFRVGFDPIDFLKRNMNKELTNYSNASFSITQKGQIKIAGLYNFDYNSQNTIRMKVFPSIEAEGIESMVARGNFLEVSGLEAQGEETVYLLSDVLHYKPLEEDDEKNDDQGCGC